MWCDRASAVFPCQSKEAFYDSADKKRRRNTDSRRHNGVQRKRDRFVDSQMITVHLSKDDVLAFFKPLHGKLWDRRK